MLFYIMLYYVISCHITSYYIILYYIKTYYYSVIYSDILYMVQHVWMDSKDCALLQLISTGPHFSDEHSCPPPIWRVSPFLHVASALQLPFGARPVMAQKRHQMTICQHWASTPSWSWTWSWFILAPLKMAFRSGVDPILR